MLSLKEIRILNAWCRRRALRWYPADGEGHPGMVLEGIFGRLAWDRMILVLEDDGFRLRDERSETLATASDLPALFDAMDGGIAEPRLDLARFAPRQRSHGLVI